MAKLGPMLAKSGILLRCFVVPSLTWLSPYISGGSRGNTIWPRIGHGPRYRINSLVAVPHLCRLFCI